MGIEAIERMLLYGPEIIDVGDLDDFLKACMAYTAAYEVPVGTEIKAARDTKEKSYRLLVEVKHLS